MRREEAGPTVLPIFLSPPTSLRSYGAPSLSGRYKAETPVTEFKTVRRRLRHDVQCVLVEAESCCPERTHLSGAPPLLISLLGQSKSTFRH